ncbi:MAG: exostosin domain-containing protein [Candidatus Helarchaeota archaeon]
MKIYILPVSSKFQPKSQPFKYPVKNKDYGVEQDFLLYLRRNLELTIDNPDDASWHYLPIFWTRWHLNHNYAKFGLYELQGEIDKRIIDDKKTFTICQYDDGPVVNLGDSQIFLSSRKGRDGIDIPLLRSPHKLPFFKPKKKYLACFVGRITTHELRKKMVERLKNRKDIFLADAEKSASFFVKKMLQSYIALAPRGYGGSSFRFYEALQLGILPLLIGDLDTRPFKKFINWDKYSLYTNSIDDLEDLLVKFPKLELEKMGQRNITFWQNNLSYQKWCKFVIKELESL